MHFNKHEASDSTLKRESNFLRGVLKHAAEKGYIKRGDVLKFTKGRVKTNKRPALTRDEYGKLERVAIQRYYDACNREINALKDSEKQLQIANKSKLIFQRKQIVEFICIAVQTGMRPGELFN